MPLWAIPIVILLVLALLLGIFALLARFKKGKYLRPIVTLVAKVPFMRRMMMNASAKAIERENPDLASAMRKMEMYGTPKTPQQAQKLLSRLSPAEQRAYKAAMGEQGAMPEPANRQQRRAMEKMQLGAPAAGPKKGGPPAKAKTAPKGKPGAKGKPAASGEKGKSAPAGKSSRSKKR